MGFECHALLVVSILCAPGFLSLGLAFGLVHGSVVSAGLGEAADALETVHKLQEQGYHLGGGETLSFEIS